MAEHSDREFRNLGQPWSAPLPVRATFSILHLPFQALKKRTRVVRTKKPKEKNQILLSQLFLIELDGPGHFKVPGISSLNRLILLAKEKTGEFSKGSIGRNGKVSYRALQGNINVITLQSTYQLLQYLGDYEENGKDDCEVERFSVKVDGQEANLFPARQFFPALPTLAGTPIRELASASRGQKGQVTHGDGVTRAQQSSEDLNEETTRVMTLSDQARTSWILTG